MKKIINSLPAIPNGIKKPGLAKSVGQVLVGQLSYQVLGLAISFLLVRNLSKGEYGIYTVLMSIQGMISVLSSSGITVGFQKIAANIWNDNKALSSLVKTARSIRLKVFFIALLITNIYGFIIFYSQGIPIVESIFNLLGISLAVFPDIQKAFTRIVLLLKKKIAEVQITMFLGQIIRFVIIVAFIYLAKDYFNIKLVLGASILGAWLSNIYINNKSRDFSDDTAETNKDYQGTLIEYMKLNWHNSMFYTFKGQISIFLMGVYGSGENLASLGALTRYSMVFTMVTSLTANIVVPAFARQSNKEKLKQFYYASLAGIVVFLICTVIGVYFLDDFLLMFLGDQYEHYNYELMLVFISGVVGVATSLLQGLNYSKGWMKYNTFFSIPLDVVSLVLGVYMFNITSLSGVLYLSIFTSSIGLLLILANSVHGIRNFNVS